MTSTPWGLTWKHLWSSPVRALLTVTAVTVALFLFCFLVSLVTTLDAAVRDSSSRRLFCQSAVSLFVQLPRDYQRKIEQVDGVESVSKLGWFGGYFRDPESFFAQFAVDVEPFFEMFENDIEIVRGPDGTTGEQAWDATVDALLADRRAAIVGAGIAREFEWEVGDTVPLTGTIYQMADGSAWEFEVVGVYAPLKGNVDDRTMYFRYDYLHETLDAGLALGPPGVGAYYVQMEQGRDAATVSARVDALFENGPQVTQTASEASLQASFVAMIGNLPLFVSTIGGAVVFAVLFTTVNTMLMAARQRTHEMGVLKALGFSDGALARVMLLESFVLSLGGGALGLALAKWAEEPIRQVLGSNFPTYRVAPVTLVAASLVALAMGLVAGIVPAVMVARIVPTDALRSEG